MGWAAKYGKRYRAMYRDSQGKMCSAGIYDKKRSAEDAANDAEAKSRGTVKESSTWSEWKDIWWQTRTVQPSTRTRDEGAISMHIKPRWGDELLENISKHDVQLWVTSLSPKLKPTTVVKTFRILSGSLKAAVIAEHLSSNPCEGVKLPKPSPSPDRFLSDAECEALRKFLDEEWEILFDLLLGTGMRFGEGLALHWEDVDLQAGTIDVFWSFDRVSRIIKSPKSGKSRRIPIGATLRAVLAARLEANGFGTPPDIEYVGSRKVRTGLVVGSLNERSWTYAWRAAVKVATVDGRKVGSVRAHDLRHTYASRLAQKGVPLYEIQRLLGHSSTEMTARYARLLPNEFDVVRQALD